MQNIINATKLIALLIVISLTVILMGKMFFRVDSPNLFLYAYGISVTFVILMTMLVSLFFYTDPYDAVEKIPRVKRKRPLVSILVAAFNEEEFLDSCITSLARQTYPRKEIIIVNDGSTDGTAEVLKRWSHEPDIRVLTMKKNSGKKRALGAAMLRAHGEIFVFTDSDSRIEEDAVEKMVDIFNLREDIGAVNGHVRAQNADATFLTRVQDTWYEGQFAIRKAYESIFDAVTCVSGPLAAFRRSAIYNFIPAWINDSFLGDSFRFSTDRSLTNLVLSAEYIGPAIKKKYADSPFVKGEDHPIRSWRIVYTRSARAWTLVPETFRKLIKQQIRWKKSFIRSIFLTGRYYYKRPFPTALVYYLHILFVVAGPFIAFRHLVYLPATGSILSAFLYLAGILYIGLVFGIAYRITTATPDYKWIYRPVMSILSTTVFSWLLIYSALTIKRSIWHRG